MYEEAEAIDETTYKQLIGKLIYITHSRPDIAFSVNFLSKFTHKSSKYHYGVAKHILRYLVGTKDFAIFYKRRTKCAVQGNSDSD